MKAHIFFLFCIILLYSGACSDSGTEDQAVSLGLRFIPGAEYTYNMDSRQTIQQKMAGMNSEISQHMQLQSSYLVSSADKHKRLTVNYDHFYIRSSSNGMSMEYDSRDIKRQPPELAGIASIVNHPFSIIVDETGTILEVESDLSDTSLTTGIQKQFSDSSIRQMMEQSLNIYPEKPVKKGDTWQRKYLTNVGFMEMEVLSSYKLISITNDSIAHIDIKASIKSRPSASQAEEMQMEMNGTQTGTMDIITTTGLIRNSYFTQDITGTMRIPGTEIPMSLHSETRITGAMK